AERVGAEHVPAAAEVREEETIVGIVGLGRAVEVAGRLARALPYGEVDDAVAVEVEVQPGAGDESGALAVQLLDQDDRRGRARERQRALRRERHQRARRMALHRLGI